MKLGRAALAVLVPAAFAAPSRAGSITLSETAIRIDLAAEGGGHTAPFAGNGEYRLPR